MEIKTHLKSLIEAHAPSGYEAPVRDIVKEAWSGLVTDFEIGQLGSLIGIKRATHPVDPPRKIMLAAHMDEIGMMVEDVVDGFIMVHRIAGVDNRVMLAQPVMVHGKRPLKGVVATKPPHLTAAADRKKYPGFSELIVDVGLPPEEVAELVQVGDLITVDAPMLELQGKQVAGKAMDDRACVAILTQCLHELQGMHHQWDVYATATVQEENGLVGARAAAHKIDPDIAIALDVGFATQPGTHGDALELNAGPAIALGGNIHPKLYAKLLDVAKTQEIKYQIEAIVANTGTDAWAIQVAQDGVPTALLSLPIRNMHSPIETLHLQDIKRTGRLLAHFIASLDADFLTTIALDSTSQGEE